jgi:CheY-like chemotaxis protein
MLNSDQPSDGGPARKRRVLVIDDEPLIGSLVKSICSSDEVEVFVRARDALDRARETSFDVILCDLLMPGMNGLQFYSALRDKRPELVQHFVMMTGSAMDEWTRDFLRLGNVTLLAKPFSVAELLRCLPPT